MPRLINPVPSRIHAVNDLTDETLTDRGEALKTATGLTETTEAKATGSIVFSGIPVAAETVTVNGVVFTFVAGASSGNNVHIEASAAAQAATLAARLNASTDYRVNVATYDGTTTPGTVAIQFDKAGAGGNGFTLAEAATNTTVSGANLTGGVTNRYGNVIKNFMHG